MYIYRLNPLLNYVIIHMYTINENNDEPYSHLRKSYVIFICTFDPFGKGLAKYTFNAICNEDHSLVLDDGVTRVFINTEGDRHRISRELASLIEYISSGKVTDEYTHQLDEEVNEIRNDTGKERAYMTYMQTIMEHEDIGFNKGYAEGVEQKNKYFVLSMWKNNEHIEKIARYTKLTMEQVSELITALHPVH